MNGREGARLDVSITSSRAPMPVRIQFDDMVVELTAKSALLLAAKLGKALIQLNQDYQARN